MSITIEEVKLICAKVLLDRKEKFVETSISTPLKFVNPRFITDSSALDEKEIRQLVACGQDGIGEQLLPAVLLTEGEESGFWRPELWDVIDANGKLAYRVFMYGVDNGTVFKGDTVRCVAGCSQGGVEGVDNIVGELIAAKDRIRPDEFSSEFVIRNFNR